MKSTFIENRGKEYFSKDINLLKSFLTNKVLKAPHDSNSEGPSISLIKTSKSPNKSQQTSLKVKELLQKTKNKLKLNKMTKENRFASKMKAFSELDSFIDTSSFLKNMNIINELKKREENGLDSGNLNLLSYITTTEVIEEMQDEEPIFIVDGKFTSKLPKIKMKEAVLEKAKGYIRKQQKNGRFGNRFSMDLQDLYSKEEWSRPEVIFNK